MTAREEHDSPRLLATDDAHLKILFVDGILTQSPVLKRQLLDPYIRVNVTDTSILQQSGDVLKLLT